MNSPDRRCWRHPGRLKVEKLPPETNAHVRGVWVSGGTRSQACGDKTTPITRGFATKGKNGKPQSLEDAVKAEGRRFELLVRTSPTADFKSAAFNRSATPPRVPPILVVEAGQFRSVRRFQPALPRTLGVIRARQACPPVGRDSSTSASVVWRNSCSIIPTALSILRCSGQSST